MSATSAELLPAAEEMWRAVQANDPAYDGRFVYAVKSTGIYCRPQCASRLPKKENVRFFSAAQAAEASGFRPCRKCRPDISDRPQDDKAVVIAACRYIDSCETLPGLQEVADYIGYSPAHFQRLFTRMFGLSPRGYADAARQERFRTALRTQTNVAAAQYEAGFGSSSRVYEFAAQKLGMTPGAYSRKGRDQRISYAVVNSPLGAVLVALTAKGICAVRIGENPEALAENLRNEFSAAELVEGQEPFKDWLQALVNYLAGTGPWPLLPYDVRATAFQRKVWDYLRRIPAGETRTYSEAALALGKPGAARAVARACATNPVALVVPCHRIVPKAGGAGGFRWGSARKEALLKLEKSLS